MKIAFFLPFLNLGGTQRVVTIMANYWVEKGWGVTIISLDRPDQQPFYPLDIRVKRMPLGNLGEASSTFAGLWNNLHRIARLRKALKIIRPQLLLSFLISANILAAFAVAGLKIPLIVSERSDPHKQTVNPIWSFLRRMLYPLAEHLVVLSEHYIPFYTSIMDSKISSIPNPALEPPVRGNRKVKMPAGRTLVALGRLTRIKGFDLLIQAFSQISQQFPDWNLLILGEGDLRAELEKQITDQGLERRVLMPGSVDNIYDYLQQADIFVLSSRLEGFGIVLCEAMACGLPVVAYKASAQTAEIVRDGVDGILVPPEDVGQLSDAMAKLMADEELRREFGMNAREVTERYGLDKTMLLWEQLANRYGKK